MAEYETRPRADKVRGCPSIQTAVASPGRALGAGSQERGLALTEAQVAALEKPKAEKEAHGEFVSEHPGTAAPRTRSMSAT
jgi:hypothetical protein